MEIGRILHLKSEIRNRRLDCGSSQLVQFEVSDFGFEVQVLLCSNMKPTSKSNRDFRKTSEMEPAAHSYA